MKRTNQQSARLHQLLTQCGLMEDKANLVSAYTHGRSTSSKDLLEIECRSLIQHLEAIATELQVKAPIPADDPANRMRRKIIARAHEMRWEVPGGAADMARINRWCVGKSYLHKPLNDYTLEELPDLVSQFDKVWAKFQFDMAAGK